MVVRFRASSAVLVVVALLAALLAGVSAPANAVGEDSGGVFVPVAPTRIVDTSSGVGGSSSPFGSATTRSYTVLGIAGIPTSGVSAVVVDIAVFNASSSTSSLIAWPTGATMPTAKTMYFTEDNSSRSNTAIVKVGSGGQISVHNSSGSTDVNVDIQGYFTTVSDGSSTGGFVPITPTRVANSLTGEGVPQAKLPGDSSIDIQVSNGGEIPADATAVFANV
ncbi:MAG: hypothetical protein ABIO14_06535 [Aeromicrobium sp.]